MGVEICPHCVIFSTPYYDPHLVRLLLMGTDVTEYLDVCDFIILGDLVPVNKNQLSVPLMSPITCKRLPILLDVSLLDLGCSGNFMKWQYFCAFPVLGHINSSIRPGWRARLLVSLLLIHSPQYTPMYKTTYLQYKKT